MAVVFMFTAWILVPMHAWAALSAEANVSDTEVFTGQPFTLQISVSGSDSPERPDLSGLDGFTVAFEGGSQNSSSMIRIINGRIEKNINQGYVFSYTLTPLSPGKHTIGPIKVHAQSETALTRPVSVFVKKPGHSDDFKLDLSLSQNHCYTGEPVILTVTWYLASDVRNARFTIPVLEKNDLFYIDDPVSQQGRGGRKFTIPANNGQVIGFQGKKTLNGREFTTISFQKVLIPKKAGSFTIKPASVAFSVLSGYRQRQSPFGDDFFSNFFNNRGFGRQGVYRQMAVASSSQNFTVADVPSAGRPADFSGLVGKYRITAAADPVAVSVGDPITLTISVSGPDYLEPVDLPQLSDQSDLVRDFKIPSERAPGKISGDKKIFTQTIRPMNPGIKEIPAIRLSYFDTGAKKFKTAKTDPIPISVKAARMITAKDIETPVSAAPSSGSVKSWNIGIAANYEDDSALENQVADPVKWLTSRAGLGVMAGFPLLYIMLSIAISIHERKKSDPLSGRAKKAGKRLAHAVSSAAGKNDPVDAMAAIITAFRSYLGDKLRLPPGALTMAEVEVLLREKGATDEIISETGALFADCEAARYGGGADSATRDRAVERAKNLAKRLEKVL